MDEKLIAPCGINCSLCISYQFMKKDLNKEGFRRTYCPGCIPRGKTAFTWGINVSCLEKVTSAFVSNVKTSPVKI